MLKGLRLSSTNSVKNLLSRFSTAKNKVPQNLVEKIVQKYAVELSPNQIVRSGDLIFIRPQHVMTHDNTSAVMSKFKTIGVSKTFNPRQPVFALDHDVQNKAEPNLEKYRKIQKFASDHGIDFYPAGRGIGHQIMVEEGYAFPLNMIVASDSHSNMYGGIGSLGTPIVRTDAAAIWATGQTWWQVPSVAKIKLHGKIAPGVTGKDIIITLCGHFNKDDVLNYCVEFFGDGIAQIPIDDRLAIANMTTEWGALAGVFPVDSVTLKWLRNRADFVSKRGLSGVTSDKDLGGVHPRINHKRIDELEKNLFSADEGAYYHKELSLDLSTVSPHVSGPNHVKVMESVHSVEQKKVKINKAYLVSCVNSRLDDIHQAAEVIRAKGKINENVKFYVGAASSEVQSLAEKNGDWKTLVDAGAVPLPAGCGPCVGLGTGLLEEGEVGISATNRNFKGRMGHPLAKAFLASPAVVAASAVAGYICAPNGLDQPPQIKSSLKVNPYSTPSSNEKIDMIEGFPERVEGKVVFCHQDNLNTDGIYPGKYTYKENVTLSDMATYAMENYDPNFSKVISKGDILVGGFNFGTGSSREQAATALKACGIPLLIAGSFSDIFKRNSINNSFLLLEVPELTLDLLNEHKRDKLTVLTNKVAKIDFTSSHLVFNGKKYNFSSVGKAAQELMVAGGLEQWVQKKISK